MTDSITIDNYIFKLIRQTNHTANYNHVVEIGVTGIIDKREFPNFWVYQSNSELGFWRLCYIIRNRFSDIDTTPFYKGDLDYIQSTLIHLELQNFININITNIPFVQLSYPQKIDEKFCLYGWFPQPMDREEDEVQTVSEVIDDENRIIIEQPFESLNNKLQCGFTANIPYSFIQQLLEEFSDNFSSTYHIVDKTLLSLYKHNFNFGDIIVSQGNIYSIHLERNQPSESLQTNRIILYFMMTELNISELVETPPFMDYIKEICGKKYHIFPFLLIPVSSSINHLGIYTKFIPCGIYICKLFDYSYQCSLEEENLNRCSDSYSYIGNRYDNLFPFNIVLTTHIQCSTSKGGYKQIKRKSLKRKSLKRKFLKRKSLKRKSLKRKCYKIIH
jgi:hypothetical protein